MRIKKAVSAEYSGDERMEHSIMDDNRKYEIPPAPIPSSLYIPKTQEIGHENDELYAPAPIQSTSHFNLPRLMKKLKPQDTEQNILKKNIILKKLMENKAEEFMIQTLLLKLLNKFFQKK